MQMGVERHRKASGTLGGNMETQEQLQERIKQLEVELAAAKAKNKPTKTPELMVEYETGYVQIRRLTGKSINLPRWVIQWILENAQQILLFISTNKDMLAERNDTPAAWEHRAFLRRENLTSANPIVRKPRAKSEPA